MTVDGSRDEGHASDSSPSSTGASDPSRPPTAGQARERLRVTRRDILRYGSIAAAGASVAPGLRIGEQVARLPFALAANQNLQVNVTRARDMLLLRFEFFNLKLLRKGQAGPGPVQTNRLVRKIPSRPGYVVVHFGPQAVGERAYVEAENPADSEPLQNPPIPASLAGPSRVAFEVPDDLESVPFTLNALLHWNTWDPRVPAVARKNAHQLRPDLFAPLPNETAIEAPWRLIMSPAENSTWGHAFVPVTHAGRTELWHSRLGAFNPGPGPKPAIGPGGPTTPTLRAVWTPGFKRYPKPDPNQAQPYPGTTSLSRADRYEIIRLTSDWKGLKRFDNGQTYNPQPVEADRFMLSALGAWIETEGDWPSVKHPKLGPDWISNVIEWDHRAVMGRDTFVRVVRKGFLFPTGHQAVVITITERRMEAPENGAFNGKLGAYLRQFSFIVVREPLKTYGSNQQAHDGLQWPFPEVRLVTRVTPILNQFNPSKAAYDLQTGVRKDHTKALNFNFPDNLYGERAFWPRVGTEDFRFHLRAVDLEDHELEFSAPLIFVQFDTSTEETEGDIQNIIDDYASDLNKNRRRPAMQGQKVSYADLPQTKPESAAYDTEHLILAATLPTGAVNADVQPFYFPVLAGAQVRISAAEQMKAGTGAPLPPPTIAYHPDYLDGGDNPGKVWAVVADPTTLAPAADGIPFDFDADKAGACITPYLSITGLSALTGPVGGAAVDSLAAGNFVPQDFFDGGPGAIVPKILGGIPLWEILGSITGIDPGDLAKLPKLLEQPFPDRIEVGYDWEIPPEPDDFFPFSPVFEPKPGSVLALRFKVVTKLDGGVPGTPEFQIVGELTKFTVNLLGNGDLGVIKIPFNHIRFTVKTGAKPDIDVDMPGTEFAGVFEFINKLQQFLKTIGVTGGGNQPLTAWGVRPAEESEEGGGLDITVDETGIAAGFSLEIPSVVVGAFSLENISFNLSFTIPWIGDPAQVVFSFCTRERPFVLTVMGFGGGGFVALTLTLEGFHSLEAEFFAAAQLAVDFGVASGKISINVGLTFLIEESGKTSITAFVRLKGEVDVLGLIYACIELYLALTFIILPDGGNELWGEASITVEVEVLIFSGSVTIGPVEKRLAGGGGGGSQPAVIGASGAALPATADNNPISFAQTHTFNNWKAYAAAFADSSVDG